MPITAATQQYLPIADIVDDIVLTKDGGACLVLKSTAVNFSLLSEREQEALTLSYASLLNSLSFPMQIVIRSHRKDVSNYLAYLEKKEVEQKNQKLKSIMGGYREFVSQVVKKRNVLEKEFYLVLRFSPLELGVSLSTFTSLFSPKKTRRVAYAKEYVVKKAKTVLYPRRDHLLRQSGRMGIRLQQATTNELIELFSQTYKPNGVKNVTR